MRDRSYLAVALFAAVAVLTLGITPPSAVAAPGAPTNLTPDGTSVASNPVLGWKPVRGAETYRVEVSTSPEFGSPIWSAPETANRYATPTTTLPAGRIFWRVQARDSNGVVGPWATASFDVESTGGPGLLSPADGASLPQPQEPPQLSWSPVRAAYNYEVEVGLDPGLVGATTYQTKTTSYLFSSPQAPNTWYWRVRALRSADRATEWSQTRSYTVEPIAQPTNPTPASSPDTLISDVVLGWDAANGAQQYEVRVSTDRNFSTIAASGTTFANRWSPATTLDNDQYWWQVRALDVAGRTSPWPTWPDRTWQFERRWQFGADPDPVRPQLLHPADGVTPSVDDPFSFQWEPVRLASRYLVQMGTDENFSPDTFWACSTHETTLTPRWNLQLPRRDCNPRPGGTYYWRVQGIDEGGEVLTPWSEVREFTYRTGGVTVTAPSAGATVDVPTMRWQPADGAERYKVTWSYDGTTKTETTYSTSYTPNVEMPATATVTWAVQAIYVNGDVSAFPLGGQRSFTLSGDIGSAGPTPVLDPPETGALRFPSLSWSPVTGADYYKLRAGHAGTNIFTSLAQKYAYPAGTDITDSFIKAGDWDYFVTAYDENNVAISNSDVGTFTVEPLGQVNGERLALSGLELGTSDQCTESLPQLCRSLTQTPVLDWDPVEGASHYLVYLARDASLTNMIYEDYLTRNTRWTPSSQLPDSQAGQAYYWVIRACKSKNACAPDPTAATHAFDKISNQVQPTSPTEGASVSDVVTFEWRDYLRTNVGGDTGLIHNTVEAANYRVQVANNSQFADPFNDFVVDQTTFTSASRLYPEGPLYWRVAAIDGTGNQLPWSSVVAVTKTSSPVVLESPADGGLTTGNLALRWRPQPFVSSYQVEVYRNNDENFSPANRVVTASSKMPALSVSKPLPASPTPYTWRVRKVDGYGNVGPWSSRDGDVWSFRIRAKAPRLVAPAAGVYVAPDASLFTWNPVGGAAYYRYERRIPGASSSSESITTPALAWAPTVYLNDGPREWRVSSIDTDNNVLGSSPWRTFKVDGTAPTVVSKSPATRGRPGSNAVATFSEVVRGVDSGTMKLFLKGRQHPLSAPVSWDAGRRQATLNPSTRLQVGKTYRVTLSSTIADPAGNALAATGWRFTVRG